MGPTGWLILNVVLGLAATAMILGVMALGFKWQASSEPSEEADAKADAVPRPAIGQRRKVASPTFAEKAERARRQAA